MVPKILVIAGSIRTGSFNARLAALAVKELALAEADVSRVSLLDYPLPIYDGDLEARSGPPDNAIRDPAAGTRSSSRNDPSRPLQGAATLTWASARCYGKCQRSITAQWQRRRGGYPI